MNTAVKRPACAVGSNRPGHALISRAKHQRKTLETLTVSQKRQKKIEKFTEIFQKKQKKGKAVLETVRT